MLLCLIYRKWTLYLRIKTIGIYLTQLKKKKKKKKKNLKDGACSNKGQEGFIF